MNEFYNFDISTKTHHYQEYAVVNPTKRSWSRRPLHQIRVWNYCFANCHRRLGTAINTSLTTGACVESKLCSLDFANFWLYTSACGLTILWVLWVVFKVAKSVRLTLQTWITRYNPWVNLLLMMCRPAKFLLL